jgi:hypothetical protein
MTTITSPDIDGLHAALTHDNWFEIVFLLRDAYLEAGDAEASEACTWLWENGKRPYLNIMGSGEKNYRWCFFFPTCLEGELKMSLLECDFVRYLDNHIRKTSTPDILPQLTAFVYIWKTGRRP